MNTCSNNAAPVNIGCFDIPNKIKQIFVTFSCSKHVHCYYENGSVKPMSPFMVHLTREDAEEYLRERGVDSPQLIENK